MPRSMPRSMRRRRATRVAQEDRAPRCFRTARSQETRPAPPQREGLRASAAAHRLLPHRMCSGSGRPPHERLRRGTQCLCGSGCTAASLATSPKKPKTMATGDSFPTDWSPPPIEFLTPRAQQAGREAAACRLGGAVGPPGPVRRACWVPVEFEQKPQGSDHGGDLDSLEQLFRNVAGPSQQLPSGGSESYSNSLDHLLQERREQAPEREQEQEALLAQGCPVLGSLELDEEDLPLTTEHRELVERFSTSLKVIPSVHPGETVFVPRHRPLPCILDCSHLKPRNHLEELFLSSPLAQQLSFLRSGLLSNLYVRAPSPTCPAPLLQWLFQLNINIPKSSFKAAEFWSLQPSDSRSLQLLAWPPETSSRAFVLLWDLSMDRLFHLSDEDVHVWCPSLREVQDVFRSLGARGLHCAPLRTVRVLKGEASPGQGEQTASPREAALDICLSYICKFLTLCALGQPGAFTDGNLMDLVKLLCRAGLDSGLRLLPKTDLQQLLLLLLGNIQEWPGKLRPLCCALRAVSSHHHNLLALVQLFPDVAPRSRQLRGQLSLVVMAQLLGQQETPPLWQEESRLVVLSRLLSLMRLSSLGQYLASKTLSSCQEQQPKASAELDYQVCYLCHSLLTLAGVVVSCQDMTPDQWGQLRELCVQLDCHINTHIRESPQAVHRTKLKDLAAQTYVRWQEQLSHCQSQAQYFSPWEDIS